MSVLEKRGKGIATHTLVLVGMIALFAIAAFVIFGSWSKTHTIETTAASCAMKKALYCSDWRANGFDRRPWAWESREPTGCDRFDIVKPEDKEDCKGLV